MSPAQDATKAIDALSQARRTREVFDRFAATPTEVGWRNYLAEVRACRAVGLRVSIEGDDTDKPQVLITFDALQFHERTAS